MKICQEGSDLVKIRQGCLALYMKTQVYCCRQHKFGMKALLRTSQSFHILYSDIAQEYMGNTLLNFHCNSGYVEVKLDWLP
jgi:hypothetical protein